MTFRSICLGACLIPLNCFWIIRLERVLFGPYPSTISLFANVIFELFLLVILNSFLRKFTPKIALSQGELLTLYTMLAISTGIAGLDGVGILSQMMPHAAWFGKQNHWEGFVSAFPSWLTVNDREVLKGHFLGNSTFYRPEVLRVFAIPILAWTGFITVLMFTANCINVLVRRQWADKERLTFPITWLPMQMTDTGEKESFFQNKLMWWGFGIAALISLWNGIAFLYPSLPSLNVGITEVQTLFKAKPWNAIDWLPITFYPLAIGLGFLLPLDLLFSCWFFFLFWRAQVVISSAMAWDTTPDFPFIKEQGFGSLIALFFFYFWSGRRSFAAIGRAAFAFLNPKSSSEKPEFSDAGEAMSDRTALLGLFGGFMALVAFCVAAKVGWWVAAAFFAIYFPSIAVITRIRAELGAPVHDFHFMGPDSMLPRMFGANAFHKEDMAFFTFGYALTRAHRSDTMPIGLEGLQMAKQRNLNSTRMLTAIIVATILGALGTFWAFEHNAYTLGVTAKFNSGYSHSGESFARMSKWVAGSLDDKPNLQASAGMAVGAATTFALFALRLRFFGFPLHPLGYAISSSWAIHLVWMPMLIAWILKSLTMRYGGLAAYRKFLPFFLGLILGDCVMGSIWGFMSLLLNTRTYNFFGA